MAERFTEFTERARKTLQLAQEEAQRFGHSSIGTEHILIGLLQVEDGIAARVLKGMDVDLKKVRTALGFVANRDETMSFGYVELTERAQSVIRLAVDEAWQLNSHYVDTEHLLLGLLRLGEGTAVDILKSLGVSLESLSAATLVTMGPAQLRVDRPPESVPMTGRFDKFTERARKTLQLAQEEAQRFNHNYIGTEHILLGLVREGHGVAARVLYSLGVELSKVRVAVEFIIGRGDRMVMGEIGLTPRAKRVIELAVDEARRLNHHYIGTEHLLLGLIREGEGIAAGVLESLGVSLKKVRAATIEVLQASQADPGQVAERPAMTDRFGRFTERARNALRLAMEEAGHLGHDYVGVEHIFLGLLRSEDGVAARVLHDLGIDYGKAREAVESLVGRGDRTVEGEISLTPRAKRAIELAVDESRRMNHYYVGTEHLLLGLLRELDGSTGNVLDALGLSLDEVRSKVIEVLRSSGGSSPDRSGEATGELSYAAGSTWIPYLSPDEFREQADVIDLFTGTRVKHRSRFFTRFGGRQKQDEQSLRQWIDAELDFHILKHIDNSFLAVLRDAVPISLLLERSYVGTDHFLAAMLRDEESAASRLLRQHEADLDRVYRVLEYGIGERWANPFTYEAMRAIRIAIDDARALGVKATAVHLLLGIMLEGGNTAYVALANAGVTAAEVRALLDGGNTPGSE